MHYFEVIEKFPTEEAVIQHFIKIRYNNQPTCNHCNSTDVHRRTDKKKVFQCGNCKNDFSIFKDTMFEDTYTDLRKWMYAINTFLNAKKGISALKREIGVAYNTSLRMLKMIRIAMGNVSAKDEMSKIFEIDETYVGGKPRKFTKQEEKLKRGRGTKKIPVVGIMSRTSGKVYARVALPNAEGKKLTGKQLLSVLNEVTTKKSIVLTDEFTGYNILKKKTNHVHLRIDHTKGYAQGFIHTNTIEGFWANFKRGIYGSYHQVSVKHLQKYVNEFSFRYNNRKNPEIFDLVLQQGIKPLNEK